MPIDDSKTFTVQVGGLQQVYLSVYAYYESTEITVTVRIYGGGRDFTGSTPIVNQLWDVGDYIIEAPQTVTIAGIGDLTFSHWDDGTTNPIRSFPLVTDTTLIAYYKLTVAPTCTTDADCPAGYVCQNGQCVKAVAPTPSLLPILIVIGGLMVLAGFALKLTRR